MDNEKFMQEAISQAMLAKESGEWPFGSVIIRNGKIIAKNRCSEGKDKNVLSHAELQVVSDACKLLETNNLSDCEIYCTNEPCLMCASAIFQAKIPKVIMALRRDDLPNLLRARKLKIEDLISDLGYKVELVEGVLKEEVLELFKDISKT